MKNASIDVGATENIPTMADRTFVNGQKHSKTGAKNGKWKKRKVFNSRGQSADDVLGSSVSKRLDKSTSGGKKKSKMGSPIIVEDTAQTLRIPAVLRHPRVEKSTARDMNFLKPLVLGMKKNRDEKVEAEITVAECIKPSTMGRNCKKEGQWTVEETSPEDIEFDNTNAMNSSFDCSYINGMNMTRVESMEAEEEAPLQNGMTEETKEESATSYEDANLAETENKQLPRFYTLKNKVLAIVEPDCQFCFHGKLRVRVLYGAVRIYGAHLATSKTRTPIAVYSPRAFSPVAIEAVESELEDRSASDLWDYLAEPSADRKFAKRLQTDVGSLEDGWAVVELENLENQLTSFLANYCPYRLFPRVEDPSNHSWRDARRAEIVLQANLRFVDSGKQLTIGSRGLDDFADGICYDWETKEASRTVVAGGKGVGKSTTARYLVNKLLAKSRAVLVLDLDPGQGEFTPAGCISMNVVEEPLLGPNFTHLKNPHYQLYVGSADVTRCFAHYVDGVRKLVDRIADDPKLSRLPLVVNTMGFCKGIGWDLISYVIKLVSPTDVVQILSRRSKNNFEDTLSRQVIDRQGLGLISWTKDAMNRDKPAKHRLHVIYSEAETGAGTAESWTLEAHQQRDLVLIAYLSQIVGNDALPSPRTAIPSINAVAPYSVPFSAMSVSLAGAFIPQVLSIMNGNVVALCGVDPEAESPEESNGQEDIVAAYPRVLIRPPLSTCYGFGILRGVDMQKEQLFLNTPLTPDAMQHVNCLVGCVNLPLSLLQLNQEGAPYTGSEYDLPTSRGSRRGYYRMRYQTDT